MQSQSTTHPSAHRFIRIGEVMRKIGAGRNFIYSSIAVGVFPSQIKLSPRLSVWDEAEVDAWMQAQSAIRESK